MPLAIYPVSGPSNGAPVNTQDVADTLTGLNGSYTTRDLYARYVSVCHEAGRQPASSSRFGRAVSAYGFAPWRNSRTRGWHIHTSWIFTAPNNTTPPSPLQVTVTLPSEAPS